MTEGADRPSPSGRVGRAGGALRRLSDLAFAALETPCGRRGRAVGFLAICALLTLGPWLRPPLSPDVRSVKLPWAVLDGGDAPGRAPDERAKFRPDSVGITLLAVCALGAAVVLQRPARLSAAAGLVFCCALCAAADTALNHPELVERCDFEQEQWLQMIQVSGDLEQDALASPSNGRDAGVAPVDGLVSPSATQEEERAGLEEGWAYLIAPYWLLGISALAIMLEARGSLRRRLGVFACWGVLGLGLSGLVCARRLGAEYHWIRAVQQGARCDDDGARRSLARSLALFPEQRRLERTWLFEGELDVRAGRPTRYARFFRAAQYARNGQWPWALSLVHDLLAESLDADPTVRIASARLLIDTGLSYYGQAQQLMAAEAMWRRAEEVAPELADASFYLGAVHATTDRTQPERAEAEFAKRMNRMADRVMRADVLATLGEAYFEAGRLAEARALFLKSCRAYTLPKTINFRALRGLGGL